MALLRRLVREHEEKTASPRARTILVQWDDFLPLFRKVAPRGAAALLAAAREALPAVGPGGGRAGPGAAQRLRRLVTHDGPATWNPGHRMSGAPARLRPYWIVAPYANGTSAPAASAMVGISVALLHRVPKPLI